MTDRPDEPRVLVGIDDTDNLESRGTGFRARQLAARIAAAGLGTVEGITRHQLLVDPRIPYTSHNSSACLSLRAPRADRANLNRLADLARDFLLRESSPGSDAGLCVVPEAAVGPEVQAFGLRAKVEVLDRESALALASRHGILLEGLTGDGGGVIGALAGVGLRAEGNDGRFIWVEGVRELTGVHTADELCRTTGIEEIQVVGADGLTGDAPIDVGIWLRPVLLRGRAVLLVEKADGDEGRWRSLSRETVKELS